MAIGRGDGPDEHDVEAWEDERPRSLLSTTWVRVLVVILIVVAVGVVAVPYVMKLLRSSRPVAQVSEAPPAPSTAPSDVQAPAPPAPTAATTTPSSSPPAPAALDKSGAPAPKLDAARVEPRKRALAQADGTAPTAKTETGRAPVKGDTARQTPAVKRAPAAAPAASGEIWVQVAAFRDQAAAQRLAANLKEKGFDVANPTANGGASTAKTAPAAAAARNTDRYDVVVTGAAGQEVGQKLTAKGLSIERTGDGAIIRPSLSLRDAVSLSNDLRAEGFKVTVRRVGGGTTAGAAAAATGETLYRVRVGAFPDRAAALEAVQKLETLGYKPFIARGP